MFYFRIDQNEIWQTYISLQNNPWPLRPWLIFNGICLCLDLNNVVKAAFSRAPLHLVVHLAGWLLGVHLLLVVLSYEQQLEEAQHTTARPRIGTKDEDKV